jgi:hypothetical protein
MVYNSQRSYLSGFHPLLKSKKKYFGSCLCSRPQVKITFCVVSDVTGWSQSSEKAPETSFSLYNLTLDEVQRSSNVEWLAVFTAARNGTLSWASWIQFTSWHAISVRYILILSSWVSQMVSSSQALRHKLRTLSSPPSCVQHVQPNLSWPTQSVQLDQSDCT